MSVCLRISNTTITIEGDLPKAVSDEIRAKMSYVVPGHKFMPKYKEDQIRAPLENRVPWDGTKTVALWNRGKLSFPCGLASYCKETLIKHEVPYSCIDERLQIRKMNGWSTEGLELRDYQKTVVDKALNIQRGVMKACTGSGKTEIVAKIIPEVSAFPAMFYVTSCDLLMQAHDRLAKYIRYNGVPVKIGKIGAGECDIQPITVATVQSCEMALSGKYTKNKFDDCDLKDNTKFEDNQKTQIVDLIRQAQFVFFDECQHCSADTIQTILTNSYSARYRYGGSASPWRDDGLDILIEAAFGRRFCDVSASYLIQNGWLVHPLITFNHFDQTLGPAETWAAHYSQYIVHNEVRNRWIANRALFHMEKGRPVIILVKHVPHAENISELMNQKCEILTSSGDPAKTPKNRKKYLDQMRNRELMCIIATSLLDEGVDVPAASVGIFAGGGKSSTRELQRVGRFIRKDPNDPNKDCAYIEEFYDHTRWLSLHTKARLKILQTEPEFQILQNRETLSF